MLSTNPVRPDIISITSECQDISISNTKATGITGPRSILVFYGLEICRELKPDYIIIENSDQISKRGLEYILCYLSEIGYDAEWDCLPLTTFGVQQRRARLYLIAWNDKIRLQGSRTESIFSERILQGEFKRVSPGWRERRDIPQPRNLRSVRGFANYRNRIESIGNFVHPRAAQYLFECIKNHNKEA